MKKEKKEEKNGLDAKDRRMRISTITVSRQVIDNDKQMKSHVLVPFRREKTISHRGEKDR